MAIYGVISLIYLSSDCSSARRDYTIMRNQMYLGDILLPHCQALNLRNDNKLLTTSSICGHTSPAKIKVLFSELSFFISGTLKMP